MPGDAQNRLDEFEIDEVSAVDRAANGEKFVITKRDDSADPTGAGAGEADGEKAEEPKDDGSEAQADGEKADGDQPEQDDGAGEADGEKADPPAGGDATAGDEEPKPEDEEEAGDDSSAAEAEADKAAPTHEALLNEQAAALKATVDMVLESATKAGDFKLAMDHLDSAWSLLSAMRQSSSVVRLMKSAGGPDRFAPIERSILAKQAELIAEARKAPEPPEPPEPPADGGEGSAGEEAPADTEGDRWAMVLERLGSLEEKIDRLFDAQAKDAVGKALGELQVRVTKMEATPVAPSTGGSGGDARAEARKGADVDWPSDMNAPEKG